jgi:hypothetical protein
MILEVHVNKQVKEIFIEEAVGNLTDLRRDIKGLTALDEGSIVLSFVDIDDELVELNDDYDFEYLMEQHRARNVMRVKVVSSNDQNGVPADPLSQQGEKSGNKTDAIPDDTFQQILIEHFVHSKVDERLNKEIISHNLAKDQSQESNFIDQAEKNGQTKFKGKKDHCCSLIPESPNSDPKSSFEKHKKRISNTAMTEARVIPISCINYAEQDIKSELGKALDNSPILLDLQNQFRMLTRIVTRGFDEVKSELSVKSIIESSKPPLSEPELYKSSQTVHQGVSCDICHYSFIKGKRYKCLICPDFDLCAACEQENIHKHPMMVFCNKIDTDFAEGVTNLFRLKSNIQNLSENDMKMRVLRNLAGDKYDSSFYEHFVSARGAKSLPDFIKEVSNIFG